MTNEQKQRIEPGALVQIVENVDSDSKSMSIVGQYCAKCPSLVENVKKSMFVGNCGKF